MEFGMKMKKGFLLVAVLGMAGCEAVDLNQILGGLGGRINVVSATYGLNCGAPRGNATSQVAQVCSSATSKCEYRVDVNALGDPRPGCAKAFEVDYRCAGGANQTASAPAEAGLGSIVTLQCSA